METCPDLRGEGPLDAAASAPRMLPAACPKSAAPPHTGGASSASTALHAVYCRKLSQIQCAPCAHIAAATPPDSPALPPEKDAEHHAVLDADAGEVLHYCRGGKDDAYWLRAEPLNDFQRKLGAWRVVRLPTSAQHATETLLRARRRLAEQTCGLASDGGRHFASWCFEGDAKRRHLWNVGVTVASAKIGVAAGILAANATTTEATPYYFMGLIPWGTTPTTVPVMSKAAALGMGVGVFTLWVGFGLGAGYGIVRWAASQNEKLDAYVPICIWNRSAEEVLVRLQNLDASSVLYPPYVDDLVHDARAYWGVGHRKLVVSPNMAGELNPAAEEELFRHFLLRVFSNDGKTEITSCKAGRGDVMLYKDGGLRHVPDPAALSFLAA